MRVNSVWRHPIVWYAWAKCISWYCCTSEIAVPALHSWNPLPCGDHALNTKTKDELKAGGKLVRDADGWLGREHQRHPWSETTILRHTTGFTCRHVLLVSESWRHLDNNRGNLNWGILVDWLGGVPVGTYMGALPRTTPNGGRAIKLYAWTFACHKVRLPRAHTFLSYFPARLRRGSSESERRRLSRRTKEQEQSENGDF